MSVIDWSTMGDFQTRSEETGLGRFNTLKEAWAHVKEDETVWKVSFNAPDGSRVRLVKKRILEHDCWIYEPVLDEELIMTQLYGTPIEASD